MFFLNHPSDPSKINELLPFIESTVWGSKNLNLDCIKDLEEFILESFGPEVYALLSKGEHVQPEVISELSLRLTVMPFLA